MNDSDLAEATGDPRFPPRWYFVAIGVLVAVGLMLVRVHILFLLIPGVGLSILGLLAHRRGAYAADERVKNAIALQSPLPGTMAPILTMIAILLTAAYVIAGLFVPPSMVPPWAVVTTACAAGTAAALVLRRSEVMRIAGTRRLEIRADPPG